MSQELITMLITVQCPSLQCGSSASVAESVSGRTVKCKRCGNQFVARPTLDGGKEPTVSGRPAASDPVQRISRFEVRAKLGAGAFGAVYRAYDPQLDREVALKLPHPSVLENPQRVERFVREARAAAQLRHPNLVPVFESGTADGRPYIAAAFITGKPLDRSLEDDGTPDPRAAAETVRKLAEGLAYAHAQGIVHRDAKPANVLIDDAGQPLLTDFGLASRLDEGSRVTNDGAVMGTPAYMAPEQAAGQQGEAQPAADQYSLGVTLYELLTGRTPFEGPAAVVIHNQIHGTPEPPRKVNRAIPRDLETICLKAMAKQPRDRYADCQAMADDLRRWLDGQPILARRLGLIERTVRWVKREPILASGLGVVLALLTVIGVLLTLRTIELVDQLRTAERDRDDTAKASAEVQKEYELVVVERDDERVAMAAKGGDGAAKLLDDVPADRRGVDWWLASMKLARAPEYGRPLNRLPVPQGGMADLTFPAGGDGQLIGLGDDRTLTLWDVWTGTAKKVGALDGKLPTMPPAPQFGPAGPNRDVLVSGDGKRVVVVEANGGQKDKDGKEPPLTIEVEVYDVATGNRVGGWKLDDAFWPTAAVTVDGSKVALSYATAGQAHQVGVWDVATSMRIPEMTQQLATIPFKGVVLAFSPDGKAIAATTARDNGEIRAWTIPTGEEVIHVPDIGIVSQLAFAPDSQRIAAVGGAEVRRNAEGLVVFWKSVPVQSIATRTVCVQTPKEVELRFTAKATDGKDCEIYYKTTTYVSQYKQEPYTYTHMQSVPTTVPGLWIEPVINRSMFATSVMMPIKTMIAEKTGRKVPVVGSRTVEGMKEPCTCLVDEEPVMKEVDVMQANTVMKTKTERTNANLLRIWDRPDNKLTFRVEEEAPIEAIAWRGDGRRIASAADGRTGKVAECTLPDPQKCAEDSQNGTLVKVWHSRTARLMHLLEREGRLGVTCLAWSDDGVHLAAGFRRHSERQANVPDVVCWSAESRQLVSTQFEHEGPVYDLAFSPDNAVLASFGKCSDKVRLWDGETGNPLRQLGPASAFVQFVKAPYAITGCPQSLGQFPFNRWESRPAIWNRETGKQVTWPKSTLLAAADTPEGVLALVSPIPAPQDPGQPAEKPAPPEVRDVATDRIICTLVGKADNYQQCWAILADGKRVLTLDERRQPGLRSCPAKP